MGESATTQGRPSLDVGAILGALPDGVYVTSVDREIVYWSAGAEAITGYRAEDVVGRHCYDDVLVHTDLQGAKLCLDGCPLQATLETGAPCRGAVVLLKHRDGRRLPVYVKTAVLEVDGRRYGVELFGELESVAGRELASQVAQLSDRSDRDSLTGLFNRRYFDAALAAHYALNRRVGRPYGVLLLDVDGLKTINDELGHAAGDQALQLVASVLSSSARRTDVVSRYGGDEFAIICSETSGDGAEGLSRRLAAVFSEHSLDPLVVGGRRLTVSIGVSQGAPHDIDERQILERADSAMYRVKATGDHRVASDPSPVC